MKKLWASLTMVACTALTGCDEPAAGPPAGPAAMPQGAPISAAPLPSAQQASAPLPGDNPPAAPLPTERQKAEAGVGRKGQGYGGGIVTEPIHQYFNARQAITFSIQIPEGMKLFQAEHNRYPKDKAEFERAILEPAGIKLPDLPEGDRYVYDAKQGELLVERHLPGGQ